jgi:hypothetical protein
MACQVFKSCQAILYIRFQACLEKQNSVIYFQFLGMDVQLRQYIFVVDGQ